MPAEQEITDFRVVEVVRFVESNFAQDLDFNALAETLNLSASRLRQLFKEQTGVSFGKYLRQVRINRARHLLETSFLKIRKIAELVGIRDASHFVKDFEKEFDLSPAQYRKSYLSAKQKSASKRINPNNKKKIKKRLARTANE